MGLGTHWKAVGASLILFVVGSLAAVLAVASGASATPTVASLAPLVWRSAPGHAYVVPLPRGWRFRNASYPSDHATHLWYDPANALRKLIVTLSGCQGCVENGSPDRPNPAGELPQGVVSTYRIDARKLAFEAYTTDDPYPENGVVIVTERGGHVTGSIILQLWLPQSQHNLATYILNNFAAKT